MLADGYNIFASAFAHTTLVEAGTMEPNLKLLMQELVEKHGCHTVIVYGSRARGDARPTSDYDAWGLRDSGDAIRDARPWNGTFLDAFVYPESKIAAPDESMIHLREGLILCQKGDIATRFIAKLRELFAQAPKALSPDEINARRVWAKKMLLRARDGDVEANFRRVWLLTALLEDYFLIRGKRYLGPKESLKLLSATEPELYQAFESALKPGADLAVIEHLVELVALP